MQQAKVTCSIAELWVGYSLEGPFYGLSPVVSIHVGFHIGNGGDVNSGWRPQFQIPETVAATGCRTSGSREARRERLKVSLPVQVQPFDARFIDIIDVGEVSRLYQGRSLPVPVCPIISWGCG